LHILKIQSQMKRTLVFSLSLVAITWRDLGLTVDGTPTILIVNRSGVIRRVWLGMLATDADEQEVLDLISSPGKLAEVGPPGAEDNLITEAGLKSRLDRSEAFAIVDIRERDQYKRGHRRGAINIPLPELYIRMRFELRPSELQVVDCAGVKPKQCLSAGDLLKKGDFAVKLLAAARPSS